MLFAATLVRVLQNCCSVWSSSVHTLIILWECTSWALSDQLVALSVVASLFLHTTQSVRRDGSCSVTVQCVAAGVCLDSIKSDFFSPTIDAWDDYSSSGIGTLSAIPSSFSSFCSVLQIMATFCMVHGLHRTSISESWLNIELMAKAVLKKRAYKETLSPSPPPPSHIYFAHMGRGKHLKGYRVKWKLNIIWVSELGDVCGWVCFPFAVDIPNQLLHVCAFAVKKLSANIYG